MGRGNLIKRRAPVKEVGQGAVALEPQRLAHEGARKRMRAVRLRRLTSDAALDSDPSVRDAEFRVNCAWFPDQLREAVVNGHEVVARLLRPQICRLP